MPLPSVQPITLEVNGSAQDAVLTGVAGKGQKFLTDGYLTEVGPLPEANGGRAALHVLVRIFDHQGRVVRHYGPYYARASAVKTASPNLRVYNGWYAQIVAAGSSSFPVAAQSIFARLVIEDRPNGSGIVPDPDLPGSCQGDPRSVQTADPAAGSPPAQQTIGARTVARMRGISVRFTTSATAGNRLVNLFCDGGVGDARFSQLPAQASQAASLVADYIGALVAAIGSPDALIGGPPARVLFIPLPDRLLDPGDRYQLTAYGFQAGDDFGVASFDVEEWASLV